jgi:phage antirepressor YoqD-like protein
MTALAKVNGLDIEVLEYQDTWAISNKQVAEGFGVKESVVRWQKTQSTSEFIEGKHFYLLENQTGNAKQTFWTKKGVITLGFKLRETPATIAFRDWASDYIISKTRHQIPQTYSDALLLAANQAKEIEEQRKTLELQAPRIAFADKLQKSEGTLSVRDFAKVLCDKGLPLGEKRLFENLRALGLLDRTNKPYQYYVDMGVLTLKEGLYMNQTTGDAIAYTQVRVTAKGQEYIYNKLIA